MTKNIMLNTAAVPRTLGSLYVSQVYVDRRGCFGTLSPEYARPTDMWTICEAGCPITDSAAPLIWGAMHPEYLFVTKEACWAALEEAHLEGYGPAIPRRVIVPVDLITQAINVVTSLAERYGLEPVDEPAVEDLVMYLRAYRDAAE